MLIAFRNGRRMLASEAGRGAMAVCPWTRHSVKAHVGPKLQYWAYEGGQPAFEDGYELDTEWHVRWKSLVREECCEAIVEDKYLADIFIAGKYAIELQREPVSEEGVKNRAAFYKRVTGERCVYLCDISEFWQTRLKLGQSKGANNYEVIWKPRRAWLWALAQTKDADLFFDYNPKSDKLLKAWVFKGKMFASFLPKRLFIETYLTEGLKTEFQNIGTDALNLVTNKEQ